MDSIIQQLIDNELITKNQKSDFEGLLKRLDIKSNASYLNGLFQIEYKKLTGQYYSAATYMNFSSEKPNEEVQNKINLDLSNYLLKLKYCGLINDKQFQKQQKRIDNNEYLYILQLLPDISNQIAHEEYMNPIQLKLFAEKLKSASIVTSQYQTLSTDIDSGRIENPIEFLKYCTNGLIIREDDYPNEPESYLETIHKKTAAIIPALAFTDFEFQIVLDSTISDSDSKFYDFVVSLKVNGKKYKQKSGYYLYSPSKNEYYGNKIDQQEYYKIFNKIFADIQSPYRLHEVKAHSGNAVEWKFFGIIALTKEQADLLHGGGTYFLPSYESFKNKLTSKKIEQALEEYQKIGLLNHLTTDQILKAKEKIAEQENRNLNDVLLCFPNIVHSFDMELGNLEDPYAELVEEYSNISHKDFNPTNIFDNFDIAKKKKVILKFSINNKNYEQTLKIEDDWIDPSFFEFIADVVAENNLKGQFYDLYEGGQGANIIYLTTEQYNYLKANKLAVFADEWQTEEE